MDKETYPDQRVVVLSKKLIFAKVNGKEDTLLTKKYSIGGFPTAMLANADGSEIDRIVGYYPAEEFTGTVKDYLAGRNTLKDLEKQSKKNPDDLVLTFKIGDKYLGKADYAKAEAAFRKVLDNDAQNKTGKADTAAHYFGQAAYYQKDYFEAIARFTKANEMFPQSPWAEENDIYVAAAYEKAGEAQKAIEHYQKYLDTWPEGDDRDYAQEHIDKLKGEDSSAEKK
jgi:tetratricopeptide (TPR) repeat protein